MTAMRARTFAESAFLVLLAGAFVVFSLLPGAQEVARGAGATLGFSPSAGTYGVGRTFTVRVVLDSGGGVGVNAADGTVTFNPEFLSVASVQKESSVFNLWTSDPLYSNANGTVTFSSGNPTAYTKSGGALVSISFRVKKEGTTELGFSQASALAADGQGTNVLTGTGKATLTLTASAPPTEENPPPATPPSGAAEPPAGPDTGTGSAPVALDVTSPTHPDPDKWYANRNPEFRWKIPPDVAGMSATLSDSPASNPPRVSEGLIDSKRFDDVEDGIWYFNIRVRSSGGSWSETLRRRAQVDATPPESFSLELQFDERGVPLLVMQATDKTSGIDRFEVKADDRDVIPVPLAEVKDGVYRLAPLLPGVHRVTVKAIDHAGNAAESVKDFEIPGRATAEITGITGSLEAGQLFIVSGVADRNADVTVRTESGGKAAAEESVRTDGDGKWLYVPAKPLKAGDYELLVKMTTRAGAESEYSPKMPITITPGPFIARFGWLIVVVLLAAIIGLAFFIYNARRQFARRTGVTKREVDEVKFKTDAVFAALAEEIEEKLQLLDEAAAAKLGAPKMTPNDLLDKFRDALDISQDTLQKEIDDVEKTLEE